MFIYTMPRRRFSAVAISVQKPLQTTHWMFQRYVIRWLGRSSLREQLPFSYRAFAAYAWLMTKLSTAKTLPGGYRAFRIAKRFASSVSEDGLLLMRLPELKVCVDLRDPRFLNVTRVLVAPADLQREYCRFLGPGDTFVDVGANHGECSLVAAKLVGPSGLVVSIEPQPRLASALKRSMAVNNFASHRVHAVAVGSQDGVATLYVPSLSSGSAGLFATYSAEGEHVHHQVPVKCFDTLDIWDDYPGRILLKLDIEGSELAFLRGASRFILQRRPVLIIEIHPATLRAAQANGAELIQTLASLGYATFQENAHSSTKPLNDLDTATQRNVTVLPSGLAI